MDDSVAVDSTDRSEARSETLGEKRPLENGYESLDNNFGNKKAKLGVEDVKKVAEIVLVLATMGKMRGGRKPSAVEVEMMAEARGKLVEVCKEFAPKDVFPRDAFGTVIEELGLSRLREQKLGIRSQKLSISERLKATKEKMEKSEVFPVHSNMYTPPRLQSNLSGPADGRGTSNAGRMFPSDKANHAPASSGNLQNPSNAVHASGSNSRTLPYQLPASEIRPGVSNVLPGSRPDRSHFRIDGGANGSPYTSHAHGNMAGDAGKTPTWSMQPQSTAFAKIGSDKGHVKSDVSSKTYINQTPNSTSVNQQRMNFSQPPTADTHSEISKIVHKLLHPHVLDHPTWTPPSRDYMNKPLPCQICKITIGEVDTALVCDACERGYHLKCLNCNPKAIPRGEWQEWHCAKCLAISNGKPLPPKYGRVMRNINTPKLSSSPVKIQQSSDKKVMSSDVSVNGNSFSQSGSSGTANNDGKLTETPLNENQERGAFSNAPEISSNGKKLDSGLNGVIKEDGLAETVNKDETATVVGEQEGPTSSRLNEVEFVGGVVKEIDGNKYYNYCRVNGHVYKVKDYAVFSYAGNRHLPNKLQAMWEDSKTTKKLVTVTRCFFPDDLPEGVGRPCAPESSEVYESNHETVLVAGLIHGPCEVLPPSKFSEESDLQARLRSRGSERQKPLFLCKWFYDETKRSFRDVTC
ncbi:putative chromatin regulator PHD family [Helianthus debilis subsp. tardiflorus]